MSGFTRVYTGAECREIDRIAIDEYGIPGIELMNRAGRFAFDVLGKYWPEARSLTVVAGHGNNAADGYIVAGLAKQRGWEVQLLQLPPQESLQGDAQKAEQWMRTQEVRNRDHDFYETDVYVDAMLGTGAAGDSRDRYGKWIDWINLFPGQVLALDIPTGICPQTGSKLTDRPVNAHVTAMFVGAKLGLVTGAGVNHCGHFEYCDLDIPEEVFQTVHGTEVLLPGSSKSYLPQRQPGGYKNQFGHVVVVGGDKGMGGAALLTAEAALRTGAGLVSAITRAEHVPAFLARCPAVMAVGTDDDETVDSVLQKADVIAVGPGLGRSHWGEQLYKRVICALDQSTKGPSLVIDADALSELTKNYVLPERIILTPHPGEAAALLRDINDISMTAADVEKDRPEAARTLSDHFDCTVILKGAGTLIASEGELKYVAHIVNPGLGTAGSGDVLTGMVSAVEAQCGGTRRTYDNRSSMHGRMNTVEVAATAILLHGAAGDRAVKRAEGRSIVATDILENIHPWG